MFAETDIVNLIKSGIPSNEVLCSLADAIVLQNLSRAHARRHAEAQACCSSAGPTRTCRSSRSAGACASRRPGTSAATTTRRTCPIEELIFVPENAQYYAALGAVLYGLHEEAQRRRLTRPRRPRRVHDQRAARRASARPPGPPLVEDERRARRVPRALRASRSSSPTKLRRRADGARASSASTAARRRRKAVLVDYETARSSARPTSSRRATRSRTRRSSSRSSATYVDRPGREARGHGLRRHRLRRRRARGVRASRREHRRDRRPHDERGALLRRRRRHLRHRRAGHQGPVHEERRHRELPPVATSCSAGNGMLLQAMADSFGVPVTEYADVAFKAELAPKFSYGCAVFLDTDRVNFQKEGFSKEELLAGLAQVLPKNVWQYVVQIPRLAALGTQVRAPGRHAVQPRGGQGAGRLHQGARPRRRGVRAPAHRRGRRDRRGDGDAARRQAQRHSRPSSASMRRSTSSTRRKNDEETRLPLLPEQVQAHVHRHRDAPTARPAATSPASRARRAPSSPKRRCSRSSPSARRSRSSSRTWSTTSRSALPPLLRRARRCPRDGSPIKDVEVREGLLRHQARRGHAPLPALGDEALGAARSACASASRACSTSTRRRRSSARTSRRSASRSRTSSSATRPPRRCGSRAASTARSTRATRPRSRRRTSTTCSSTTTRDEKKLAIHLLPDPHARADFVADSDGQRELPHRRRRARRDEGGLHQGGRLLRHARHRVPRPGAHRSSSRRSWRGACSRPSGPRLGDHRGRERPRLPRGLEGARASSTGDVQEQGPRHPRDGRGRGPRRHPA